MSDNVRCAGGGQWYERWEDAEIGADRNTPCGWTGRLDGWALAPLTGDSSITPPDCPECGGKIQLLDAAP